MISCAELAGKNDKLELHISNLEHRIEQLRAALGCIEDVYPDEASLAPHMARKALDEDTKFIRETINER
jgi:hypothetical protein